MKRPKKVYWIIAKTLSANRDHNKKAKINLENFPVFTRRQFLYWINSAKRDETRKARVKHAVVMCAANKKPGIKGFKLWHYLFSILSFRIAIITSSWLLWLIGISALSIWMIFPSMLFIFWIFTINDLWTLIKTSAGRLSMILLMVRYTIIFPFIVWRVT